MQPMSDLAATAGYYRGFAEGYAKGESPTYLEWAAGVAGDEQLLGLLGELTPPDRQPNLLFAAARWHGAAAPGSYEQMRRVVLDDWTEVSATMRSRSTQTNEPGRCAVLLPALTEVAGTSEQDRPLALLEVGVSGGLCLYPDRYGYRYLDPDGAVLHEQEGDPVLECVVTGAMPPVVPPQVAWRGGLDLNPLDVTDRDTLAWLRVLVWPEHTDRLERLDAAVAGVGGLPREVVAGDAATDLGALMARARREASDARLVVYHTAVAAYFDDELRDAWPDLVRGLCAEHDATWLSNEGPEVLPDLAATAGESPPSGRFCLAVDGQARAWTHGHGRSMRWLGSVVGGGA